MADLIKISKLKPHPRNKELFDNVTGDKWEEFLESVRASGIIVPITITSDNTIVSGEQRVRACQELGISEIPYIAKKYKATDGLTIEDAILRDLIESNLKQRGKGNPNKVKLAKCIAELERIYKVRQGSSNEKGNNQFCG